MSRKIVDYDVVYSKKSCEELVKKMREAKKRGYEPFGSMQIARTLDGFSERFFQPVVQYEQEDDNQ